MTKLQVVKNPMIARTNPAAASFGPALDRRAGRLGERGEADGDVDDEAVVAAAAERAAARPIARGAVQVGAQGEGGGEGED